MKSTLKKKQFTYRASSLWNKHLSKALMVAEYHLMVIFDCLVEQLTMAAIKIQKKNKKFINKLRQINKHFS